MKRVFLFFALALSAMIYFSCEADSDVVQDVPEELAVSIDGIQYTVLDAGELSSEITKAAQDGQCEIIGELMCCELGNERGKSCYIVRCEGSDCGDQ